MDERKSPINKKQLIRLAKWTIAVLVVVGLLWAARSAVEQWSERADEIRQQIQELDAQIQNQADESKRQSLQEQRGVLVESIPTISNLSWPKIVFAAVLYALGLLPPCWVLREATGTLHPNKPSIAIAITAQLLGHLGKYVPGKAMVVVLRVGVLSRHDVPAIVATVSVFMETLLMMAVGASISGLIICWLPVPGWMIGTAVFVAIAASLPTLPPVLVRIAARISKKGAQLEAEASSRHRFRFFLSSWLWFVLSWLLIGCSFTLLVSAIPNSQPLPDPTILWLLSTASVSLAVVVGFASLLPGGAGVRELVLTAILAPKVGTACALLSAIAARVMFIMVETALAALAWLWLRAQDKAPALIADQQPPSSEKMN